MRISNAETRFGKRSVSLLSKKGMTDRMPQESPTPDLQAFWGRYQIQAPQRACLPHELLALVGIRMLRRAPAKDVLWGKPPRAAKWQGENTYLWVIDSRGIPYIIERSLPSLGNSLPKHSNLTGGRPDYIGGEIWFSNGDSLFLSGGSGRYPPLSESHLNDAVRVFESYDYRVTSLGWDPGTGKARRRYHVV